MELIVTLIIFFFVYLCIRYIRNNYLDRPLDYKMLHDGLIHDLHHQRFMGSINRIEGLIHVANMEEPYKDLCEKELEELKKSVAYIADKYNTLS
jgi:predicted xylose isomerase-like sugar epimerase